jgi:glucose dehydrogenase
LVFNGVMYVPHPGHIVQALDASNGTVLWEYRRERSKDARRRGNRALPAFQNELVMVGLTFDNR